MVINTIRFFTTLLLIAITMGNSCFAYAKKSDLSVVAQYIKAIEQHNVDSIKDMIESNPIEGKDNIDYIQVPCGT